MAGPRITDSEREAVQRLRSQGLTWKETAEAMIKACPEAFGQLSINQAYHRCRNIELGTPSADSHKPRAAVSVPRSLDVPVHEALMAALAKGADLNGLAQKLGTTQRVAEAMIQDARDQGYNVQESNKGYSISKILPPTDNWQAKPWGGEKMLRFGLVSDTHIGGVDTQLTLLHHLYDYFEQEGIADVYHAGDITDGERMRPGHEYELYMHGADAQVAHTVKVYPRRKGINTTFITGNHDYSFIKTIGLDIGRQISAQRDDMHYAGYMNAIIQLSPGCTLELKHPQDGSAYAMSYKPQKIIEALAGGEKPSIMAIGHYHKRLYMEYRNIHCVLCATTEAQTVFMRGRGLSAHLGGTIIELKLRDDGVISEFTPRFISFYASTKDDYKNWL